MRRIVASRRTGAFLAARHASEPQRRFSGGRLAGAAGWRFAYLFVEGGASILIFSGLAHILGREQFASAVVAQGVVVVAQTLGDFGLSQTAVAFLPARAVNDSAQASALWAGASRAYLYAALIAVTVSALSALLVPTAALLAVLAIAPAAGATVLTAGADGLLRASGEFRRPVLLVAASRAGMFLAIPAALLTHSAAWSCGALSAGTLLGATGALLVLLRWRRASSSPRTADYVRSALPLGLSQLAVAVQTRFDTILAGALSGLIAAGTFEGAWRIYQLSQYAVGGLATASAPFLAERFARRDRVETLRLVKRLGGMLLGIGTGLGLVIYLARGWIAHVLAGSLARPVEHVLPIVVVLSPLAAITLLAYYALAANDGQRQYVFIANAIGAAVNVVAVLLLAPQLGGRGVVIGCGTGLAAADALLLARFVMVLRAL